RYDNDPLRGKRMAADTFIRSDTRTRQRPLKRPQHELAVLLEIKPDPEKTKDFFQHGGNIREVRDQVTFAVKQGFDLRRDLAVACFAGRILAEKYGFCHKL